MAVPFGERTLRAEIAKKKAMCSEVRAPLEFRQKVLGKLYTWLHKAAFQEMVALFLQNMLVTVLVGMRKYLYGDAGKIVYEIVN